MRRLTLVALTAVLAACGAPRRSSDLPRAAGVFDGTGGSWVDLTWPADTVSTGGDTRMEAPARLAPDHLTADRVPLAGLIGPAAVVDVSARADADYQVSVDDLKDWETRNGELPNGGILLLRTGWDARHDDPAAYQGGASSDAEASASRHFPGLAADAARWLVAQRGIVAVGIDTPALDRGIATSPDARQVLFDENIAGFENVANLDLLPEAGSYAVALPSKIRGADGAPLRIVAFIPR